MKKDGNVLDIWHFMYWALMAVVIYWQGETIGITWQRRETHRWTLGYFTVFFLGLPLVLAKKWDAYTFLGLFGGVGTAGAIKVGVEAYRNSTEAQRLRNQKPTGRNHGEAGR